MTPQVKGLCVENKFLCYIECLFLGAPGDFPVPWHSYFTFCESASWQQFCRGCPFLIEPKNVFGACDKKEACQGSLHATRLTWMFIWMYHVGKARENTNTNVNMKLFTSQSQLFWQYYRLSRMEGDAFTTPCLSFFSLCFIRAWNNANQLPVFGKGIMSEEWGCVQTLTCWEGLVVSVVYFCGAHSWSCRGWISFILRWMSCHSFFAWVWISTWGATWKYSPECCCRERPNFFHVTVPVISTSHFNWWKQKHVGKFSL